MGKKVWTGHGLDEEMLDEGFLVHLEVFFHLYEKEWKVMRPLRCIPIESRSENAPYNYEVKIADGRGCKMDVLFQMEKFVNTNLGAAPLGSWCIIENDNV